MNGRGGMEREHRKDLRWGSPMEESRGEVVRGCQDRRSIREDFDGFTTSGSGMIHSGEEDLEGERRRLTTMQL